MKIDYRALWIEDHLKSVEPVIQALKSSLKDYGFNLVVEHQDNFTDESLIDLGDRLSVYNPYDIIFFDYDLGTTTGDLIASQLRQSVYTDMIFYSGKKHEYLRKGLYDNEVDGVYIANREHLVDDALPIIEDQIKRICDINNMRGILLDEMSKIDLKIRELYKKKYQELGDKDKISHVSGMRRRYKNKKKTFAEHEAQVSTQNLPEMIMEPIKTEFNIIRLRLKTLYDNGVFDDDSDLVSMQALRNIFGHNMTEYDEENGTVSLSGFDETYSFHEFNEIRKGLIELVKEIDKLE